MEVSLRTSIRSARVGDRCRRLIAIANVLQRLSAVARRGGLVPLYIEPVAQDKSDVGLIVDDEYATLRAIHTCTVEEQ